MRAVLPQYAIENHHGFACKSLREFLEPGNPVPLHEAKRVSLDLLSPDKARRMLPCMLSEISHGLDHYGYPLRSHGGRFPLTPSITRLAFVPSFVRIV